MAERHTASRSSGADGQPRIWSIPRPSITSPAKPIRHEAERCPPTLADAAMETSIIIKLMRYLPSADIDRRQLMRARAHRAARRLGYLSLRGLLWINDEGFRPA